MPRRAGVRWVERDRAWCSDVGERGPTGRRSRVYLREGTDGRPLGPGDRLEALAALAAWVRERDGRESRAARRETDPTVAEVVAAYLADCRARVARGKLAARTLEGREEVLPLLLGFRPPGEPAYGDRPARDFAAADLARLVRRMEAANQDARGRPIDGYGPHYIQRVVSAIKACWAWAARPEPERDPERLIPADTLREVRGPELPAEPERYVSPDQAAAFLGWVDARFAAAPGVTGHLDRLTALLFRLIYESGCRPGEACRAEWADFDPDRRIITLGRDAAGRWRHKTGGKTRRARRVPLTEAMAAALLAERDRPGRHEVYVFTHRRGRGGEARRGAASAAAGEPWSAKPLGKRFRELRSLAAGDGLDVRVRDGSGRVPSAKPLMTLYDFRRSWTTDAWESGISPHQAAGAQGHSVEVAERAYATRNAAPLVEAADAVARRRAARVNTSSDGRGASRRRRPEDATQGERAPVVADDATRGAIREPESP